MNLLKALPALLLTLASLSLLVPAATAATNCAATYGPGYSGTGFPATGDVCFSTTACGDSDLGLNGKCVLADGTDCSAYGAGYFGVHHPPRDACVNPSPCPAGKVGVGVNGVPTCVAVGTIDTNCAAQFGPGYVGVRAGPTNACVNPGACPAGTVGVGVNGVPECVNQSTCAAKYGAGYMGASVGGVDVCVKLNECSARSLSVNGICIDLSTHVTNCAATYGPGYSGTGLGGRADACIRPCPLGTSTGIELNGESFCF